ncbi:type VI secretion lipoprotein TssJ [Edwardsiella piscicida]|nr:type VI secretion lipoprotein TssJ [Edwardsiella piscicida]
MQVSRYALEPGHAFRLVLDRLQEARQVGFIAAFYGLPLTQTSRLFDIPVSVTRSGILFPDWQAAPSPGAGPEAREQRDRRGGEPSAGAHSRGPRSGQRADGGYADPAER